MSNDLLAGQSKVEYSAWLADLKQRIREAQTRAVVAVNAELVLLYWQIGRDVLERQERQGWGLKWSINWQPTLVVNFLI